jgi:hypothetical protein
MDFLSIQDLLSVSGPARDRLRDADEAIRAAVVLAAVPDDEVSDPFLTKAAVALLLVAASREVLHSAAETDRADISLKFQAYAADIFTWVAQGGDRRAKPVH